VRRAGRAGTILLLALSALAFAGFVSLGSWQLYRLAWKRELIAAVDARIHAPAVPAPLTPQWPAVDAEHDAYRHVSVAGVYVRDLEALVQAVTEEGPGFWVLTPLHRDDGSYVLINRGFVDAAHRDPAKRDPLPAGRVIASGLLRLSEPDGGFLRDNVPQDGRWYSRDVAAIGAAQRLPPANTAPYFVDAAAGAPGSWPIGGLTVVRFWNHHLSYALTWYALAALLPLGLWLARRSLRHEQAPPIEGSKATSGAQ